MEEVLDLTLQERIVLREFGCGIQHVVGGRPSLPRRLGDAAYVRRNLRRSGRGFLDVARDFLP
jgi:hypothetical protein